ncbi:tetratricopeptide repeat protein [Hanstruepera ponticola]|uniref:tetratricopeptide repeat protein n=1 Tax=Hanstruepera ponticola TaxID=2042995 RepID=UPI000CF1429A|nr:hypothetical protein [Hanstruepera ponticola]
MKLNLLVSFFVKRKPTKQFFFCLIFFAYFVTFAHGDLSKRIEELSSKISKTPHDSELYLERGFLYQLHLEFDEALEDYFQAEKLGLDTKLLQYRKAETFYQKGEYRNAHITAEYCLKFDTIDVKTKKLQAQILISLERLQEALDVYDFVIKNTQDIRPEDIIEYAELILTINPSNYPNATKAIDIGLKKLGQHTFSLQLKKLDYFIYDNQESLAIDQFNYFILTNNRKEFWYHKKAEYLYKINKPEAAKIAIMQSRLAIQLLDKRFQEMKSIKNLTTKLDNLENLLNNE